LADCCADTVGIVGCLELDNKLQNTECDICKWMVQQVEVQLAANHTEQQIINTLQKQCSVFVISPVVKECQTMVQKYVPQIIQQLEQKQNPNVICKNLNLCKNTVELGNTRCDICKWIVEQVERELKTNNSEQQIINNVSKQCSIFILHSAVTECQTLVKQFVPKIIIALENKETPDVICKDLNLCKKNRATSVNPVGDTKCDICRWIVEQVEHQLANNQSEQQIINTLQKQCSVFILHPLVTECQTLVKQNVPKIIIALEKKENPATICKNLNLCKTTTKWRPFKGGKVLLP